MLTSFWMCTIFKVFVEFVTMLRLFYVLLLGQEACDQILLAPWLGMEPPLLPWKVKSSPLNRQGKSSIFSNFEYWIFWCFFLVF